MPKLNWSNAISTIMKVTNAPQAGQTTTPPVSPGATPWQDVITNLIIPLLKATNAPGASQPQVTPDTMLRVVQYLTFQKHDEIIVDDDLAKVKKVQQQKDKWTEGMEQYIGKRGKIVKMEHMALEIKFSDGKTFWFDAQCINHIEQERRPELSRTLSVTQSKYKQYDIVRIESDPETFKKLQQVSMLWTPWVIRHAGRNGIVDHVDDFGDAVIHTASGKLIINPDALSHVNTDTLQVEDGDLVLLQHDRKIFEKNQKGRAVWSKDMEQIMGRAFIVHKVVGGQTAVIQSDDKEFIISTTNMQVVDKLVDIITSAVPPSAEYY